MKKLVTILAAFGLVILSGCGRKEEVAIIAVTEVKVAPATLTLVIGESKKLDATVEPSDATDKTVLWSSSNAGVAMVGSDGLVAALKEGSATITATAGGKTSTCNVTVVTTYVEATGLTLDKSSLDLTEGDTYTLSATIAPSNASNKYPEWTSSDSNVAVVDGNGKVVALKAGSATITATVDKQSASCQVTVAQKILAVSRVILDKENLGLIEGDTYTLTASVEPDYATDQTVTWSTSDAAVATVTDGLVTAIAEGSAIISATAGDFTANCEVTVYPEYEYVDLGLSVLWGTYNIGATIPEEYGDYYAWGEVEPKEDYSWATYKWCDGGSASNLTKYNTSNLYGASVDRKTVLEPEDDVASVLRGPKWRIPTSAEWEELRANCNWTRTTENDVAGYRISSRINEYSIFIPFAGYQSGTNKREASEYGRYWSSSIGTGNPCNASLMYHHTWGGYYITEDARCFGYSVRPVMDFDFVAVESITLNKEKARLIVGRTLELTAIVTPAWATNSAVTWKSSSPQVASVEEGLVKALAEGIVTITASADGKEVSCEVTVETQKAPEAIDLGISINWASFNLGGNAPEDYGDYYAWGEVEYKDDYSWATYKWCDGGSASNLTKYNTNPYYGEIVDYKTVLEQEDDAAHSVLGSKWRTPTSAEWEELRTNCNWQVTTQHGVAGYRVSSRTNDNSIFLPFAGFQSGTSLQEASEYGRYWSSSIGTSYPYNALFMYFHTWGGRYTTESSRCSGYSIRAVMDK